jgi:Mu-like prophage protein gpG
MSIQTKIELDPKGTEQILKAIGRLREMGYRPRQMMRQLGAAMIRIVGKNFEEEGRPTKWKKRSSLANSLLAQTAMNRARGTKAYDKAKQKGKYGILRRAAFKAVGNKVLSQSGELKKSMVAEATDNQVAVGPGGGIPYARIHHFGGVIRAKGKSLAIPIGGGRIVRRKSVKMPARPYLVIPESENSILVRIALEELKKAAGVR